jgi:hypothetical protein
MMGASPTRGRSISDGGWLDVLLWRSQADAEEAGGIRHVEVKAARAA